MSGALALNALTHMPEVLCLLIVVALQLAVAFLGHNLIHVFERYAFPVLVIIFLIASVWTLGKATPGAAHKTIPGAFLIELGATFGYAVGWNPYASDYTRYFKPDVEQAAPSPCGPASACSCPACCSRPSAPPRAPCRRRVERQPDGRLDRRSSRPGWAT